MMNTLSKIALPSSLLIAFAASASAAVSITTQSTAPSGAMVASYVSPTVETMSASVNHTSNQDRTLGQSFTSTVNGAFNSITVKHGNRDTNNFSSLGAGQGDMIFAVWNTDTNTSLGTFTFDFAGQNFSNKNGGSGGGFLTFNLDTSIAVSSGVEYAFEFGWNPSYITDDTTQRNFAVERNSSTDNYTGGGQISRQNYTAIPDLNTNGSTSNNDLEFYVNSVAVPEPSSTALLGLGGLALMLRRRKH